MCQITPIRFKNTDIQILIVFIIFSTIFLISCKKENTGGFSNEIPFNPTQLKIAEQTVSVFENSTTEIQYGYIEYLDDGRGYTAGRAGFTSATCDLLSVISRYQQKVPNNILISYIPRLQQLCDSGSGSVSGLEGFPEKWISLADDVDLRAAQDAEVNDTYFVPAYQHCTDLGLKLPFSLLAIYDAIIQHGDGSDPDGLPAMIARTSQHLGGSPAQGINEKDWIKEFLSVRKSVLLNATDPSTRAAWIESVSRVDALALVHYYKNFYLNPPVKLFVYEDLYSLPQ